MASTSDDWGFSVSVSDQTRLDGESLPIDSKSGPPRADKRVSEPVKDDWDDDDDEDEDPQKVWEDA